MANPKIPQTLRDKHLRIRLAVREYCLNLCKRKYVDDGDIHKDRHKLVKNCPHKDCTLHRWRDM